MFSFSSTCRRVLSDSRRPLLGVDEGNGSVRGVLARRRLEPQCRQLAVAERIGFLSPILSRLQVSQQNIYVIDLRKIKIRNSSNYLFDFLVRLDSARKPTRTATIFASTFRRSSTFPLSSYSSRGWHRSACRTCASA